jgi:predicted ATP-grasp superfamily ATP-dependent carboligase
VSFHNLTSIRRAFYSITHQQCGGEVPPARVDSQFELYRTGHRNGEFKLIEINPRHWDWHRLGTAAGVNLSWTAYCDLTGHRAERAFPRSTQAKWIAEDTFLHYVFQDIFHGKIDMRDLFSELSGQRIYGIFAWNDPLPFVRYSLTVGLPRMGRKIVTALGHKVGFFSLLAASLSIEPGTPKFYL